MSLRDLRKVGHFPSLVAGLVHFEVSFAVWVLLGVLAPFIAGDLGLSPAMKGLLVGTPLLSAAAYRVIVGWLGDTWGPKRVGTVTMLLVLVPLAWAALGARTTAELFAVAVLLGIAGSSFAVALPLASANYPPSHQGIALGIAAIGNSGTVAVGLLAPRIATHIGWHATMGLAIVPVTLAAGVFWLLGRESTRLVRRSFRESLRPLRETDCWNLCGLYAVTFGGYLGFTSYLTVLLVDRFSMSKVTAASFAAAGAGLGSLLRPVGGYLADRYGGTRVLAIVYGIAGGFGVTLSVVHGSGGTVLLFIALLGTLGVGNGAVFQLVPLRFPGTVGLATGIVGAAGGVGGFFVPSALGALRQLTGTEALGLAIFGGVAFVALGSVLAVRVAWRRWEAAYAEAAA